MTRNQFSNVVSSFPSQPADTESNSMALNDASGEEFPGESQLRSKPRRPLNCALRVSLGWELPLSGSAGRHYVIRLTHEHPAVWRNCPGEASPELKRSLTRR